MLFLLLAPQAAPTQAPFAERYTKREVLVPMRDGVRLHTVVYEPKDASERHPILLHRTGYSAGPYGATYRNPWGSPRFVEGNYVFVFQDVRGRYLSEGEFEDVRPDKADEKGTDETTDTYDTVDWLVKNVRSNNGRVGLSGISYPGFYAAIGAANTHPALKAVSPQAPVTDWWVGDDFHHHGAFFLQDAFGFMGGFGVERPKPTAQYSPSLAPSFPDAYRFFLELGPLRNVNERYFNGKIRFWNDLMEHPNYDAFWKARDTRPRLKNVTCAVLTVGGLFDAEDNWGAFETYRAFERNNPGIENTLVMGPWYHGQWAGASGQSFGDIDFGQETGTFFRERVEFPFFEHHLKGGAKPRLPEIMIFETGGNRWRAFEEFPPKGAPTLDLFLDKGGLLNLEKPKEKSGADSYVSDPARPVPFTMEVRPNRNREYMIADQRFASRRPDVLTYETPPLPADLTVAGPIKAELQVSTSGTDADFIVKVIDVFPDALGVQNGIVYGGYQMLVRAEVLRGRYRDSYEKPKAFGPNRVTKVTVPLNEVMHTFKKGHRVMVQVQSSWFPLVDRNPQTFVDIAKAGPEDFKKATIRVYRHAEHASKVTMTVLPK
ncbi:MAG: CocE/NonD family hydrolase [Fimbriimonas sp.]